MVWDLDDTLWHGTIAEGDHVVLNEIAVEALKLLDQRGLLNGIASRNDKLIAEEWLERLGVIEYFVCRQIHWGSKAVSIREIASDLNIGIDTIAFFDDNPAERAEIGFHLPDVSVFDASSILAAISSPDFIPSHITNESAQRRALYQTEERRRTAEKAWVGPAEDFLKTLKMEFSVCPAEIEDLRRIEELTVRTNQLNSTGKTYTEAQLIQMLRSEDRFASSLTDLGTTGKSALPLYPK